MKCWDEKVVDDPKEQREELAARLRVRITRCRTKFHMGGVKR